MSSRILFQAVLTVLSLSWARGQAYQEAAIQAHNLYRSKHVNTGPMKLAGDLAAKALKCSEKNAANGNLDRCDIEGLSSNLCAGNYKSDTEAAQGCVKFWYDSIKYYDYNKPGFIKEAGSFTKLVWKSSTTVGCGVAKGVKEYFTTCLYFPKGNINGQFQQNVLRPK